MTALWQRAVASRYQRAAWLVLAVGLAFNCDCSIILATRTATACYDEGLSGCFRDIRGRESGLVMVMQDDCNMIHGYARGLTDLGPPANDVWVFNGELEEGAPEDGVASVADLKASWDDAAEEQTLHAIHHAAPDTAEESLTLTHLGTGTQVELVRCEL